MIGLYRGADLFVFPSLYEGFGIPPLEAMACGTAVVSSDRTSLPEVVGDAGVLVDPTDPAALAGAIGEVLGSASRRRDLERRGLARVARFTWRRCVDLTIRAYREAAR
jgi:glycosyltransferase involved in cell wall biosynthesis